MLIAAGSFLENDSAVIVFAPTWTADQLLILLSQPCDYVRATVEHTLAQEHPFRAGSHHVPAINRARCDFEFPRQFMLVEIISQQRRLLWLWCSEKCSF